MKSTKKITSGLSSRWKNLLQRD